MATRFKDDARPAGIWHSRELRPALTVVQEVWRELGFEHVWITCGPEGEHSAGSFHGCGDAVDIRSRDMSKEQQIEALRLVREKLRAQYPGQFDFILEGTHFHLEYDPR